MLRYSRGRIIALIIIIITIWCTFSIKTCSTKINSISVTNSGDYVSITAKGAVSLDIVQSAEAERVQGENSGKIFYPDKGSSKHRLSGNNVAITLPSYITDINVETPVGNITLTDFRGSSVSLDASIGNISAQNITALDVDAYSGTGNIKLDTVKAESINIDAGVGDISLLSAEAEDISADTGIGDIDITLTSPLSEYALDLDTSTGVWKAGDASGKMDGYTTEGGGRTLSADTGLGDITIDEV